MKKLLLVICLASLGSFTQAQTTTAPATNTGKHKKANLAKDLNLNDTQKKSVAAIHKSNKAQLDSIKKNSALSETEKKAELKKIKQGERKSVAELLTTEQKAKLAELQPKKKGKKVATTN